MIKVKIYTLVLQYSKLLIVALALKSTLNLVRSSYFKRHCFTGTATPNYHIYIEIKIYGGMYCVKMTKFALNLNNVA